MAKKAMSSYGAQQLERVTAQLGFISPQRSTNSAQEKCTVDQIIDSEPPHQFLAPQRPNSTHGNDSCSQQSWVVSRQLGFSAPQSTSSLREMEIRNQPEESTILIHSNGADLQTLEVKYKHFVESYLKRRIHDPQEAAFGWIYKLQDRECQDSREVGNSELPFISGLQTYLQNVDGQILKLRKHLADLQMTTVKSNMHMIH
jgi:hypothetical protein